VSQHRALICTLCGLHISVLLYSSVMLGLKFKLLPRTEGFLCFQYPCTRSHPYIAPRRHLIVNRSAGRMFTPSTKRLQTDMCKCINMFIVVSVAHYSTHLTYCCRKTCFQTSCKRIRNTSQGTEVMSITTACHPSRKECQHDIPMRCQTCAGKDKVQGVLDHGNRENLSYIILYRRWP